MLDANPNPEASAGPADPELSAAQDVVVADLLVEDVSIDGMCGVY
jgi:mycofactocin precursor